MKGCSNRRRRGNVTDCYHALQKCLHWPQTSPPLLETFIPMNAMFCYCCCYSVIESCLTLCNPTDWSMPSFPCPSPSPGVCSSPYPLSQWCHPAISSSVAPFSSCLQSFPASGSFPMNWLFATGSNAMFQSVQLTYPEDHMLQTLGSTGT